MMSVNVSSRQFHVQYFIHKIETFTSKNPVLPNMLEMEITESVLMENQQSTIVALKTLSKLGFKITIDDFGTGYSSIMLFASFYGRHLDFIRQHNCKYVQGYLFSRPLPADQLTEYLYFITKFH